MGVETVCELRPGWIDDATFYWLRSRAIEHVVEVVSEVVDSLLEVPVEAPEEKDHRDREDDSFVELAPFPPRRCVTAPCTRLCISRRRSQFWVVKRWPCAIASSFTGETSSTDWRREPFFAERFCCVEGGHDR